MCPARTGLQRPGSQPPRHDCSGGIASKTIEGYSWAGELEEGGLSVDEHEKTMKAAKQVEAITGFYIHLVVFVLVMAVLLAGNWLATPDVWWVQWPFLGWGIGVLAHALIVFGSMPSFITRWQLRKIKDLKDRM